MPAADQAARRKHTTASFRRRHSYNWNRPEGISEYAPVPREAWTVKDAPLTDPLSPTQRRIMEYFDARCSTKERCPRCEKNSEETPCGQFIRQRKYGNVWIVVASQTYIARALGCTVRSVRNNIRSMIDRKHVISPAHPVEARVRQREPGCAITGRRPGEGNNEATRYIVHSYNDVRAAIMRDDRVGKIKVNGQWHWFVRGRGRHFMTMQDLSEWKVEGYLEWIGANQIDDEPPAPPPSSPRGTQQHTEPASMPHAPPDVAAAVRAFRFCANADDLGIETVWRTMITAAGSRPLGSDEMVYLLDDLRASAPQAPNTAYIATAMSGRTRAYLNQRPAEPAPPSEAEQLAARAVYLASIFAALEGHTETPLAPETRDQYMLAWAAATTDEQRAARESVANEQARLRRQQVDQAIAALGYLHCGDAKREDSARAVINGLPEDVINEARARRRMLGNNVRTA